MGLTQEEARAEAVRRIAHARDTSAEVLDLGDLGLEELPEEICELRELRILALGKERPVRKNGTWEWERDVKRPGSPYLVDVSSLGALTALTALDLSWCRALSDVYPLGKLVNLTTLNLDRCSALSDVYPLGSLTALSALDLSWCKALSDVSPLGKLVNLTELVLNGCLALSDVSPLGALTNLAHLDLSSCRALSDVSPLGKLAALTHLNLHGCSALSDVYPLWALTALTHLDLSWCRALSDVSPLGKLATLTHLNLHGCSALSDVSPLGALTALTHLQLSPCVALSDVSPLGKLVNLTYLVLDGRNAVSDVSPLGKLVNLTGLVLNGCRALSDVSPLGALTALTDLVLSSCGALSDVAPLGKLAALTHLQLSECEAVSDVSPLGKLVNLTALTLSRCWALSDVAPLGKLAALTHLDLSYCDGISFFHPLRPLLPQLARLYLYRCNFHDLPAGVCGSSDHDDVIDEVRAYYADLDAGAEADAEVKLFVLGNGRVGKTQLVRRLRKQPYDDRVPTTHGVEWHNFPVEAEAADGSALPVSVNLWDFGGQDIYHGSHALFLDRHAVFVVLWHPEFESGTTVEHGTTMTNHPLAYWLDYVRAAAGPDAVVLLVQARADTRHDEHPLPDIDTGDLTVRHAVFSAKTGRGFGALQAQIQDAVRDLIGARPPQLIGRGRLAVRNRLRAMLAEDQKRPKAERKHRLLTEAEFQTICDEEGGVSSAAALLTFLHRTGVVFHNPKLFGGQIVLDQQWALDAIYTLLDRARAMPLLRALHGRFTRAEIEGAVWGEYTPDEQKTFLGMMRSCDICFPSGERNGETVCTAPELLPEDRDTIRRVLAGRLPSGEPDVSATARFQFLHDGILRSVLAHIGRKFGDLATYWKWGCFLYDEEADVRMWIEAARGGPNDGPGGGTITLRAWGKRPEGVVRALVSVVNEAAGRQKPDWKTDRKDDLATGPDFVVEVRSEGRGGPRALVPGVPPDDEAVVAISYAHGDERGDARAQNRKAFVDGLERTMPGWGYRALRDVNELKDGATIREFVPTLVQRPDGRPRRVVLVLSDKYLRSVHCMAELHAVYQLSLSNRAVFAQRAVPCAIETDLNIYTADGQCDWRDHWRSEHERLARRGAEAGLLREIERWWNDVAEMLHFVANMVTDPGYESLTANGFAAVKRMLDRPRPGG